MPPKGQRDTERTVTLTPQVDATTLRLDLFASLSKWPTLEQALVKLFFRVGARMHELILIHQATWVANAHAPPQQNAPPVPQVYVELTDDEKNHMVVDGQDPVMKACNDAITTAMKAAYVKYKCTSTSEKEDARLTEVQLTSSGLLASLLEACSSDARFSHLKDRQYIVDDRNAYSVITPNMALHIWSLPAVQLLVDIIDTVYKQKLTANESAAALFLPPNIRHSIQDHKDTIAPALRALNDAKLTTAEEVLSHLQALSLANFVTTCANSTELPKGYREAYQLGANVLSDLRASDPTPLTVDKMLKITDKIRRALEDRKLPPAPIQSSKIATLARLEQDGQQPRFTRGRGAKRGAPRGGAGGNRHRKEMDPSTRQCNICEVFGHTWLECPKGNKTMQQKEIARRAERQARNGARALRRAKEPSAGVSVVSEDEVEEDDEELEGGVNLKHCSVSLSHTSHTLTLETLRIARTFCTHKAGRSYSPSSYDLPNAFPPALDIEEEWQVNKILPLEHTPLLHAPDHITILRSTREALASDTKLLTFRSPEHGDSIVHMYPLQCTLRKPDIGAVLDTGAQRSAAKCPAEILAHTHSSHTMQGAFGKPTTMKGILMGCATVDIEGTPLTIVIPDESVFDPLLSDSLVSTGRLMEAGFGVIFRLPKDAGADGFHPDKYPLYGGTILTPENPPRTIIIEYQDHTWRLPVPQLRVQNDKQYLIDTRNSFTPLSRAPAALSLT